MRTAKTLIRLGGCTGSSESSFVACHFVGFVMRQFISVSQLFYSVEINFDKVTFFGVLGFIWSGIPILPTPILPTPILHTPDSPTLKFYLIPVSPTVDFCTCF